MADPRERTPFIFDDIAVQFNWNIFFLELFAHIFPGGFFFVNYKAHSFISKSIGDFLFNGGSILAALLLGISYILCGNEETNVISQAFIVPLLLFVIHKVYIATEQPNI